MSLNPNARPFVFNPRAASFDPTASAAPAPAPVQTPAPAPAPVVETPVQTPAPVSAPVETPASTQPAQENWEDESPKETEKVTESMKDLSVSEAASTPKEEEKIETIDADLLKPQFDPTTLKPHDEREHLNIVCIGHVDAGKSTISGQILLLTGQVDERTIAKYEREAKEKNRESWYLAFIMDTNEEERAKGKTVEVGRAHFTTPTKRYTLLDAPGHKMYVPNMIGGTSQADVGVLVISARKGEFETGFEKGGQTREHAMLAKTLGIQRLIILVNKMDDPSVKWDSKRYDEIVNKLTPFLKQWGYNTKSDVIFCPCSGLTGANLKDPVTEAVCPWYNPRLSFMQILDSLQGVSRDWKAPLRIPIITRFKDMGSLYVVGKVESGTVAKDTHMVLMPSRKAVYCTGVQVDEVDVECARAGENVLVKIKGAEEEDIQTGMVLSYPDKPCKRSRFFDAQVAVLDLLEHKPILTAGYQCILHLHTVAVECTIKSLLCEYDKKTNQKNPKKPRFLKSGAMAEIRVEVSEYIAVENFKEFAQMGRFTLRDEGSTIAVGKVTTVYDNK